MGLVTREAGYETGSGSERIIPGPALDPDYSKRILELTGSGSGYGSGSMALYI